MAGIFGLFGLPVIINFKFGTTILILGITFSTLIISIAPNFEKDFKRTVANSTVLMVGLILGILLKGFSTTAFFVAANHAAYKAATFLVVGKVLNNSGVYGEHLFGHRSIQNSLFLILIFLIGFRTTSYATGKHALDAALFSAVVTIPEILIFGLGLFAC